MGQGDFMIVKRTLVTVILLGSILALVTGCFNGNSTGNSPPRASFTATPISGEAPLSVSFNASNSYDSDGSIAIYEWSFGDGESAFGVTVSHTYTSPGSYLVQLVVTDQQGALDSAAKTITVLEPTLSPPAWIIGMWAPEGYMAGYFTFIFSSDNVIYKIFDTVSISFKDSVYNVSDSATASSYTLTIQGIPGYSIQVTAIYSFQRLTVDSLSYSMISGGISVGVATLIRQ